MKNPWLGIALSDYEAHMALPEVGQAQMLADVFAGHLDIRRPGSLAVIGCAGLRQIATAKRRTPSRKQFQVQVFRPR
jgi:hypothetical protein